MNKETLKLMLIALFIASLVAITFVGNVYYNISIQVFIYGFSIASMILIGIGRILFKKDKNSSSEQKSPNEVR